MKPTLEKVQLLPDVVEHNGQNFKLTTSAATLAQLKEAVSKQLEVAGPVALDVLEATGPPVLALPRCQAPSCPCGRSLAQLVGGELGAGGIYVCVCVCVCVCVGMWTEE